jgi:tripartite-type tricarboxylate transporter receptor subunit TctC
MRCVVRARRVVTLSIAAALPLCPLSSWAQSFPSKPVRYIVPFGPGGSPDIVARLISDRLTRLWGQQVIVENRAGVAGTMGTAVVAKSPPDGHSLVQCNIASSGIGVTFFTKLPYDHFRDIAAVTRIGMTPNMITVHPSVPIHSIKDLIAYAKKYPDKLSYTSGQVGTSPQLSMELLKLRAGIQMTNIPYKIGAQAFTDTMAGQVPVNISNAPLTTAHIQAGRVRPLAVTSATRAAQFPSVPTVEEAGLPDFDVQSWQGVCAPAATPAAILDKLNEDIISVLRIPEIQQRLTDLMMPPSPTTRDEFDRFIRSEVARWDKVITDAKIQRQ